MNNSRHQPPNITCENKLDVIRQRIVWKIDNYSVRSKKYGYGWTSSRFEFIGANDGVTSSKWELKLYPLGESVTGFVSFKLFYYGEHESIKAFYEVSISGVNDAKLYTSTPIGASTFSNSSSCPIQQFIKLGDNPNVLDCLVHDTLTVVCDITILGTETNTSAITAADPASNYDEVKNLEEMSDDLLNAFNNSNNSNKDSSDVTIKCDGKEFYCHQFILSARSPIFEAMLHVKMIEQETGNIEIEDFSKDVVEKMLAYIYGGVVPNIDKDAKELLNIAEKYQLQQLKISLGEKLVSTLNNDNCIEYLAIGYVLHVNKLKEAALKFFRQNAGSIMENENWKQGLKNVPAILALELMEEVVKK